MMTGKIKNVHTDKGFGFITGADGVDYFFHRSALMNVGIGELERGHVVTFEPEEGTKGPRAVDVNV